MHDPFPTISPPSGGKFKVGLPLGKRVMIEPNLREYWRKRVIYRANNSDLLSLKGAFDEVWRSPTTMPRWASRIDLVNTSVRVERVQDASEEDAKAEGFFLGKCTCWPKSRTPIEAMMRQTWCHVHGHEFKGSWNSKYAKDGFGWDANPFTWVIGVRREYAELHTVEAFSGDTGHGRGRDAPRARANGQKADRGNPMTMIIDLRGQITDAVLRDCPRCHGVGTWFDSEIDGDRFQVTARICNCHELATMATSAPVGPSKKHKDLSADTYADAPRREP